MKNIFNRIISVVVFVMLFHSLPSFSSDKKNIQTYLDQIEYLTRSEQYEQALTECNKTIKLYPKNIEPYFLKVLILFDMKDFIGSIAEVDQIINKITNTDEYYGLLSNIKANSLRGLKRYDEALIECDKIIQLNVDDYHTWMIKGGILISLNRPKDAISVYDKTLAMHHPEPEAIYLLKGQALVSMEEYSEALKSLDTAIKLNDKFVPAYLQKGLVLKMVGKNQEALPYFKKAIELDPNLGPIEKYINNDNK